MILILLLLLLLPSVAQAQFGTIPDWNSSLSYDSGYLVKYNGTVFICGTVFPTKCTQEPNAGGQWNSMAGYRAWASGTTYQPGQLVVRQGSTFMALKQTTGDDPAGGTDPHWAGRSIAGPPSEMAVQNNSATLTDVEIQAAIDRAPVGGIVQLACAKYTLSTSITITKNLTLKGCGGQFATPFFWGPGVGVNPAVGTVLCSSATCGGSGGSFAIISIDNNTTTAAGILIADLSMIVAPSGTGIFATNSASLTGFTGLSVNRLGIDGGQIGVRATHARGITIRDTSFMNQLQQGIYLTGGNCDDGGVYLVNNNILTCSNQAAPVTCSTTANDAILLEHIAASVVSGNFSLFSNNGLRVLIGSSCSSNPGPSQYTITGNQLENALGGQGNTIIFDAGAQSGSNVTITGNQLASFGPAGAGGDTIKMTGSATISWSNVTITGNVMSVQFNNNYGCVNLENVTGATVTGNSCDVANNVTNYVVSSTGASSYGVYVANNTIINPSASMSFYRGSGYTLVSNYERAGAGLQLSLLPNVLNGSQVWCGDCTPATDPCSGSGSGAMAVRYPGPKWKCL